MAKRIAVFGQAAFGKDVLVKLADAGHEIVGVYAPPDKGRPDPLAAEAEARGLRLLRHPRFRRQGVAIPELVAEYLALGAELNVMPYTTVILPPEIVDAPAAGSLCFHPSLLPRFRGGAAIPWQIILGERETGVTVFQPDAGVDTGPIVVQRGGVTIDDADNAATLYFQKLYPLGVEAVAEAVDLVDRGAARPQAQDESRATFQGLVDEAVAAIDFAKSARELARLVRGCDPQPGAWARFAGAPIRLFDARFVEGESSAAPGTIIDAAPEAIVVAARGGAIRVGRVKLGDGKKVAPGETALRSGDRLESAVA